MSEEEEHPSKPHLDDENGRDSDTAIPTATTVAASAPALTLSVGSTQGPTPSPGILDIAPRLTRQQRAALVGPSPPQTPTTTTGQVRYAGCARCRVDTICGLARVGWPARHRYGP